jgi:hypothetical protein
MNPCLLFIHIRLVILLDHCRDGLDGSGAVPLSPTVPSEVLPSIIHYIEFSSGVHVPRDELIEVVSNKHLGLGI